MAMTAWSAKVLSKLDLLVREGLDLGPPHDDDARWARPRAGAAWPASSERGRRPPARVPACPGTPSRAAPRCPRRGSSAGRAPPARSRCRGWRRRYAPIGSDSSACGPCCARRAGGARPPGERSRHPSRRRIARRSRPRRPAPAGGRSASWRSPAGSRPVAVCCSSASVSSRFRLSQLREQAHVLDGDHRLVGEGLERARSACRRTARPRAA